MIIKTKFNVGDEVWEAHKDSLRPNYIQIHFISEILICIGTDKSTIQYKCSDGFQFGEEALGTVVFSKREWAEDALRGCYNLEKGSEISEATK